MKNFDIQPELPYREWEGEEETKSEKIESISNTSTVGDKVSSIQSDNPKNKEDDKKIDIISNERDSGKKLVPDEDRDGAYLIHNILKKREGWETGSWSLFQIAESRSKGKLSFKEVERLRKKYCIVDYKRAGKNYYIWNDRYVFDEPILKETKHHQNQKDVEREDWWNDMGRIISPADAYDRWEKQTEFERERKINEETTD